MKTTALLLSLTALSIAAPTTTIGQVVSPTGDSVPAARPRM